MGPIFSLTVTKKSLSISSVPLARLPKTKVEMALFPTYFLFKALPIRVVLRVIAVFLSF